MCERGSNLGMGFTAKTKESTNNSSESWAMGFLFIFFPEEEDNNNKILNKKPNNFSFSSSSSPSFKSINAILKRSNSTHLLSKAQSTISICALLIFITLLLFTLSTFEPTSPHHFTSRKQLSSSYLNPRKKPSKLFFPHALQGMGSLYRRGTRAMNDLIIAHVVESVTVNELKSFLRLIHRSSVTSKSDILLIFPLKSSSFDNAIVEENNSFLKLIHGYCKEKDIYTSSSTFDPTQFVISSKKENSSGEPMWGRKIRSSNEEIGNKTESTRLSYGSIVSFVVDELDPENSLSGFLDHVPMNLRRWACYPMLLGRIRRNYKHILVVDVKDHLVLGDSLNQLKNRSPETVILPTIVHKKKNSEKKLVDSGIVFGGARGIRRLANAMVTEIARVAIQHKKKNSVSESGLFNQLVGNELMLKNVNLINPGESIHELSSLTGLNSNSNSKPGFNSLSIVSKYPIVRRGNSNLEINSVFKKYLCSSPLDSIAYSDC